MLGDEEIDKVTEVVVHVHPCQGKKNTHLLCCYQVITVTVETKVESNITYVF